MNTNFVPLTDTQWQRLELFFLVKQVQEEENECQVVDGSIISEDYRKFM